MCGGYYDSTEWQTSVYSVYVLLSKYQNSYDPFQRYEKFSVTNYGV